MSGFQMPFANRPTSGFQIPTVSLKSFFFWSKNEVFLRQSVNDATTFETNLIGGNNSSNVYRVTDQLPLILTANSLMAQLFTQGDTATKVQQ